MYNRCTVYGTYTFGRWNFRSFRLWVRSTETKTWFRNVWLFASQVEVTELIYFVCQQSLSMTKTPLEKEVAIGRQCGIALASNNVVLRWFPVKEILREEIFLLDSLREKFSFWKSVWAVKPIAPSLQLLRTIAIKSLWKVSDLLGF